MQRYLSRRLLQMVPTFLGITLLTFAISHLAPGDPLQLDPESASSMAGAGEAARVFRETHGLDLPLPVQYARWLKKIVTLDFGRSLQDHRLVSQKVAEAIPKTLMLSICARLLAYGLAIPIGVHAAVRRRSALSRTMSHDGAALSAVTVSVLNPPELGQTGATTIIDVDAIAYSDGKRTFGDVVVHEMSHANRFDRTCGAPKHWWTANFVSNSAA